MPYTPYTPEPTEDFYLWHLCKIGVLDQDLESDLWQIICDGNKDPVTVAIIDTGIDTGHPNLNSGDAAHPWPQIDFTPHLYGARYVPPIPSVKAYLEARARREPDDPAKQNAHFNELARLRQNICDEVRAWGGKLGLDVSALDSANSVRLAEPDKDNAFHKVLAGMPGQSGFPARDARTPGPTKGDPMLPGAAEPGMVKMQAVIGHLGNDDIDDALKELWTGLQGKNTINIPGEDPSRYFGAHGTACAGLIGGRPALPGAGSATPPSIPKSMDYFGVNPYCKLLPIATPYSHEILPLIHALIYAVAHGAQVIHIPRGLPDYVDRNWKMKDTHFRTRIDRPVGIEATDGKPDHLSGIPDDIWTAPALSDAEELAIRGLAEGAEEAERDASLPDDQADFYRLMLHSKMFERLLAAVGKAGIYVVLSAGNDGWAKRLSYPARSAVNRDDKLVVVGAANRWAYDPPTKNRLPWYEYISSYSNGRKDFVDLGVYHALSDDGFALDQERVAFDERGRDANDYSYEPHLPPGIPNSYSDWGLLTLDVRGSYGYAAGKRYDPPEYDDGEDLDALYTLFGGTSGASALVAGLISLWLQAGETDIRRRLRAHSPIKHIP